MFTHNPPKLFTHFASFSPESKLVTSTCSDSVQSVTCRPWDCSVVWKGVMEHHATFLWFFLCFSTLHYVYKPKLTCRALWSRAPDSFARSRLEQIGPNHVKSSEEAKQGPPMAHNKPDALLWWSELLARLQPRSTKRRVKGCGPTRPGIKRS